MITPMTKLTMLIYHRDYKQFLLDMRDKGIVHVHTRKETLQDEGVKAKMVEMKRVYALMHLLEKRKPSDKDSATNLDGKELFDKISATLKTIEDKQQLLVTLEKDLSAFAPWGDFSETMMQNIEKHNFDMRFFTTPVKKYDEKWESDFNAFIVNELAGLKYFVTLTRKDKDVDIEADRYSFPKQGRGEIQEKIAEIENEIAEADAWIDSVAKDSVKKLADYRNQIREETDLFKVEDAAAKCADDKLMFLEGWVPTDIEQDVSKWLTSENVYFEMSKPEKDVDNPPIKLKNNAFARLFEVIGEMYSIPTYWELDLTPFFAPFYMLFFGFCLGDAGYGLLFVVLTAVLLIMRKLEKMRPLLWLAFFLGLGTTVMGTVSGTFFGMELLKVDIPFVNYLKQFMFGNEGAAWWYSAFYVSLIIGVIQILFGMCLKIVNQTKLFGFQAAVSTVGWVVVLLGGIISYLTMGIGTAFYACMIVGALLIFIFNGPMSKIYSPFVNIGSGLWDTYNMATGLLGDVLSYIRLFALGLSGSILGLVFNDLAIRMSPDVPVLHHVVMILILVLGHAMNIGLSALSAFVHPMRLTFVEFYKNSGFKGGAKKYEPFKKV